MTTTIPGVRFTNIFGSASTPEPGVKTFADYGISPNASRTANTAALAILVSELEDGDVVDTGSRKVEFPFSDDAPDILINKNVVIRGNAVFAGRPQNEESRANKARKIFFRISHSITVDGPSFKDLGTVFYGDRYSRANQDTQDNASIIWRNCEFLNCNSAIDLGGENGDHGTVDAEDLEAIKRIAYWEVTGCHFDGTLWCVRSRAKKHGDVKMFNNTMENIVYDIHNDGNYMGANVLWVNRIGMNYGTEAGDADLFLATMDSCVIRGNRIRNVEAIGNATAYGWIFYADGITFTGRNVCDNIVQREWDSGLEDYVYHQRPVSGVYCRGRGNTITHNFFTDCSSGTSENGMVHLKARSHNTEVAYNTFRITAPYKQIIDENPVGGIGPIGIENEKSAWVHHNEFWDVRNPVNIMGSRSSTVRSQSVCEDNQINGILGVQGRIRVANQGGTLNVSRNKFTNGGAIRFEGGTDNDNEQPKRIICDGNEFYAVDAPEHAPVSGITFTNNVLKYCEYLSIRDLKIYTRRPANTDMLISGSVGNPNLVVEIVDPVFDFPSDVSSWGSSAFEHIYWQAQCKILRIIRPKHINARNRAMRIRNVEIGTLDITDPYFENVAGDEIVFEGSTTLGKARLRGFHGDVKVDNQGVVAFDGESSKVVSHGIYGPANDDRAAILAHEIELRPLGDAGTAWVSGVGATNFTINTPANYTGDIAWIAKRTDRFEDYSVYAP